MASSTAAIETGASARLRAASRQALAALSEEFDNVAGRLREPGLTTLADELASVVTLLVTEPVLNKHLAGTQRQPAGQGRRWSTVCCRARWTSHTLDLLRTAVSQRWSVEADLLDGIEHIARLALLKLAEVNDEVDDVEDQLFRFGRVLDAQPRLTSLAERLHDCRRRSSRPAGQGPRSAAGVNQTAKALLAPDHAAAARRTCRRGRHRSGRAGRRAAGRDRRPRHRRGGAVRRAAHPADRGAHPHLRASRWPFSCTSIPSCSADSPITVGDEVIDGSIASRLAAAQTPAAGLTETLSAPNNRQTTR